MLLCPQDSRTQANSDHLKAGGRGRLGWYQGQTGGETESGGSGALVTYGLGGHVNWRDWRTTKSVAPRPGLINKISNDPSNYGAKKR